MYGLESLFQPAMQTAVAGAGEAAIPAVTDAALNTGVEQTLAGGANTLLPSFAQDTGAMSAGVQVPTDVTAQFVTPNTGGMFSSWGNFGDAMTGDKAGNLAKGFGQGYNLYNQTQALNNAQDMQKQALGQSQDAYARDKSADERRQKLNF